MREPLVRTVHSYAFAVLRLAAQRNGDPPPRLITSAEQDGIIRELLAGDLEDGDRAAVAWPRQLRPALTTVGFATELRDLLARCTERGVDPVALQRIGRLSGRPEWLAAGQFAQQYEQTMLLRSAVGMAAPQATVPALGAAELVGAALEAFAVDPELLAAERGRIKLLLVDDAQHLDPQAARLVRVLAAGAELTVIAGDPNQAVFGYRGADPALLRGDDDDPVVTLTRVAPLRTRGGTRHHRDRAAAARRSGRPAIWRAPATTPGSVSVRVAASPHAEAALIADALRRAHLIDGVPWSQMAVIVRSVPQSGAALPRALTAAGVPVVTPPLGVCRSAEQPAARALLTVLAADGRRAGRRPRAGPADRADRPGRSGVAAAAAPGAAPRRSKPAAARFRRPARRRARHRKPSALSGALWPARCGGCARVLAAARRSDADGADPRYTLWQAWHRSRSAAALAGGQRAGRRGRRAGRPRPRRRHGAVRRHRPVRVAHRRGVAARPRRPRERAGLACRRPATRRPTSTASRCSARTPRSAGNGTSSSSPDCRKGCGPTRLRAAACSAPSTSSTSSTVSSAATPTGVSSRAPLLAEERRLLIAAMGRARRRLLVTAVDSDSGDDSMLPSPFFARTRAVRDRRRTRRRRARAARRGCWRPRRWSAGCARWCARPRAPSTTTVRACAAAQLARLAAAGVPGADPAQWYGMTRVEHRRTAVGGRRSRGHGCRRRRCRR